ncbi:hypothetical protein Q9L58_007140 [Maublancomyces gigas]|uniref:Uncharacterized protein n=1 Tax=Discina gigas TaxID=1032678 RepID=A0ABR3GE02_9PEZI
MSNYASKGDPDFASLRPQLVSRWSDDTILDGKYERKGERKRDKLKRVGSKVAKKVRKLLEPKSPSMARRHWLRTENLGVRRYRR